MTGGVDQCAHASLNTVCHFEELADRTGRLHLGTDDDTLRTMTDEVRLMSPPPGKRLARQLRTAFLAIAASVAVVAIVCCIAFAASTQHHKSALTDKEYAFARQLVRSEVRQEGAVLTSATVIVGYGKVFDSNVGYPCTSGRLLHIKLIGEFPHITTGGIAVQPGTALPDMTVRAVNLTADAKTGRPCLIGVQTGKVAPAPNAVSLPIN